MHWIQSTRLVVAVSFALVLAACATQPPHDYTSFKESRPRSIVVLPPLNNTPEVSATYSLLSQVTMSLAEAGYYVLPVTLVDETFRENGLMQAGEMHAAPIEKLRKIFGADAALYITITQYGTSYRVVHSVSMVAAEAKLLDLRTGKVLWTHTASASSDEGQNQQNNAGLVGLLLIAVMKQVMASVADESHRIAQVTTQRLLSAGPPQGILYGPRSPNYGRD